jgi:hypothetical protein
MVAKNLGTNEEFVKAVAKSRDANGRKDFDCTNGRSASPPTITEPGIVILRRRSIQTLTCLVLAWECSMELNHKTN